MFGPAMIKSHIDPIPNVRDTPESTAWTCSYSLGFCPDVRPGVAMDLRDVNLHPAPMFWILIVFDLSSIVTIENAI
jgi:hypothetical protein